MSETKFTQGPWRLATNDDTLVLAQRPDGEPEEHFVIADVLTHDRCQATAERIANAALIASAPDLYEALAEFIDAAPRFDRDRHPLFADAIDRGRAALRKARGEVERDREHHPDCKLALALKSARGECP